jgi:hypothetical protein
MWSCISGRLKKIVNLCDNVNPPVTTHLSVTLAGRVDILNLVTVKILMRWAGHAACMGEIVSSYGTFIGKHEREMPLGRPRRRWNDDIRMDLKEIGWEVVDGMHLAYCRLL